MPSKKFGVEDTIRLQENDGSLFWAIDGRQVDTEDTDSVRLNPRAFKNIADCTADIDDGTYTIFGVQCAAATVRLAPPSGNTDLIFDAIGAPRWKKGGTPMTKSLGQRGRQWNEDLVSGFQVVADPFKATVFVKTGNSMYASRSVKCKKVTITVEL